MWRIYEKKSMVKVVRKVPILVRKRYEVWKRIVELEGPKGLRIIKGYHDEALKGQWQGHRSSRLNIEWRVIYKVKGDVCEVFVIDVTPHDY